ncbi:hypothetical protein [Alistipes sp. 56_sp_Nov_56_25]|uniref:hypothetical protein n=1 Tax=Alistipes sp. 56_sp_Nov_56_25 TaxID=1896969 RepID=UPI00095FCA9A|nr:hypothetical protein [Alistipes sp. 56_sp_Nov_56_25]OKY87868.1 MAG: hypothetical protein BHV64_02650 [Alistipes sp. 56_sp_Nov_56_25]
MDDFATVIWVVIIAGAMIFNVVSQSRKARGKGARTPGHEEAWPSQAHPESEPDPMPAPRPAPWPVAPVFPDECQSLEEIPTEEYAPEHTTPKAAGRGHLRHQTVNRLMDDSGNDEIAAHSLTNNAPDAATTSQTEEFNLRQAIIYSEILKPKFEE